MNDAAQIEFLAVKFGFRHAGQVEQVINQVSHVLRRPPNPCQIIFPLAIEPISVIFQQSAAEAVNAPKRRP